MFGFISFVQGRVIKQIAPEPAKMWTCSICTLENLLRPLRGDRRIPFGFRHVLLEAASVESSGV